MKIFKNYRFLNKIIYISEYMDLPLVEHLYDMHLLYRQPGFFGRRQVGYKVLEREHNCNSDLEESNYFEEKAYSDYFEGIDY
jgi:hypothetical protein